MASSIMLYWLAFDIEFCCCLLFVVFHLLLMLVILMSCMNVELRMNPVLDVFMGDECMCKLYKRRYTQIHACIIFYTETLFV